MSIQNETVREAQSRGGKTARRDSAFKQSVNSTKAWRARILNDPELRKEWLRDVCAFARAGLTDWEIAQHYNTTRQTFLNWKDAHPEIQQALDEGRSEATARVARTMYEKATGYSFKSEKIFQYEGEVIRAETIEHVPPDTTAAIFWLKNRDPENWRDVRQIEADIRVPEAEEGAITGLAMAVMRLLTEGMSAAQKPMKTIEHEEPKK